MTKSINAKDQAPRWHLIYYGLAGFDIVTVIATLILSSSILAIYVNSVDESSIWAKRAGAISDLNLSLVSVNTPGNDVFESQAPKTELDNLIKAHRQFQQLYATIIQDLKNIEDNRLSTTLIEKLAYVNTKEQEILAEARAVLAAYSAGNRETAGNHMASMDQQFSKASEHLADVGKDIRLRQQQLLDGEIKKAKELKEYEYIIVGLVIIMICCVVVYGHTLSKRMRNNQTQIDELLAKNNAIIATSPNGIITMDKQGKIQTYNPACTAIFGYTESEAIGKDCSMLMGEANTQAHAIYVDRYLSTGNSTVIGAGRELSGKKKDGTIFPIHLSVNHIALGPNIEDIFVGTIQDLSEQNQLQNELIDAKDKAENSARVKSEFLASMSHEIRTPMNGVLGMLGALSKGHLSNDQANQVQMAKGSAESLLNIINDILDFSKIEAGKLKIEQVVFNIKELINEVIGLYDLAAQEKSITLSADIKDITNPWVIGDPVRVRQILTNLVGNAIKFTEQGTICVRAETQNNSNQQPTFNCSVIDSGIGISQQMQQHLFDSFTQADSSTTRKYGGTGLGLAITKQLVELMGGNISIESQANKGSTFSFNIALGLANPAEAHNSEKALSEGMAAHASSSSKLAGSKILLAEDNKINQQVALFTLEDDIGLEVDVADNGLEVLSALSNCDNNQPYQLILMDCQMPEMDGFEATASIRAGKAGESYCQVPIIALTANAIKGDREKCLAAGMNDYVSKPIDIDELSEVLQKYLA